MKLHPNGSTASTFLEVGKSIRLRPLSGDSGDFSQTNPEAPPYNHGLKTHFKWFKEHGVVEFVGPLMSDICNQD